jgi:uncharacterized protein (TIGR02996 family)
MNIPHIDNLDQAREYARHADCAGCGKKATLGAHEVQKEGANHGRLFVKCRHCGYFGWLTAPQTSDTEVERAQAGAGPCPKCGKERQARRVSKEGDNKGRLFLTCVDPACDSFEWIPPALVVQPAAPREPTPTGAKRTEQEFLADIRDNPENEDTLLIYADWLDDHDEPARAELIRISIERDRLAQDDPARNELSGRIQAILTENEAAWTAPLRPLASGWKFVRGLIDEVELEAARFVEHADTLLRLTPTSGLRIHVDGWQGVRTLVGSKRLLLIRRLTLLGGRMGGAGSRILAESPHIANLKSLSLAGQSLGQPGVQALAGSRYLRNLEHLDLSDNNLSLSAIPILASSSNMPRLRRLILANNLLKDSDARALANTAHFPDLQELDLSGNAITREGVEALNRSPHRAKLRRLVLS